LISNIRGTNKASKSIDQSIVINNRFIWFERYRKLYACNQFEGYVVSWTINHQHNTHTKPLDCNYISPKREYKRANEHNKSVVNFVYLFIRLRIFNFSIFSERIESTTSGSLCSILKRTRAKWKDRERSEPNEILVHNNEGKSSSILLCSAE
jgi:hypothetical protein